jgi:exosortase family protein XrtG
MNEAVFLSLIALYVFLVFIFWKRRIWLLYYLVGAFGFTLIVVGAALNLGVERHVERVVMVTLQLLLSPFDVRIRMFSDNALLVPDPTGWSILTVNIECSALIETSVVTGLIFFYPGFSRVRKISSAIVGGIATYLSNILRLVLIVFLVYIFGKSITFLAHAYIGRFFFFATVVVIYWYLFTRPTLSVISGLFSRIAPQGILRKRGVTKWRDFTSRLESFTDEMKKAKGQKAGDLQPLLQEHRKNLKTYRNLVTRYDICEGQKGKALQKLEYCAMVLKKSTERDIAF